MELPDVTSRPPSSSAIDEELLTALVGQRLYGLQIQAIVNQADRPQALSVGGMYPALRRLIEKGLAEAEWGEESTGGARRKYYKVTELGAQALQQRQQYLKRLAKRNHDDTST